MDFEIIRLISNLIQFTRSNLQYGLDKGLTDSASKLTKDVCIKLTIYTTSGFLKPSPQGAHVTSDVIGISSPLLILISIPSPLLILIGFQVPCLY